MGGQQRCGWPQQQAVHLPHLLSPLLPPLLLSGSQSIPTSATDGGSYIGCADIAITADGTLPNFATLPAQTNNVLPGVPAPANDPLVPIGGVPIGGTPTPGSGGSVGAGTEQCGLSTGGGFAIGALVGAVLTGGALYYWYRKQQRPVPRGSLKLKEPTIEISGAAPKPPPPSGGGKLPPGWTEAVDPASQRTYFFNSATGDVQWTSPV
mmetsp:Transcript_24387/g.48814  ORF Transcript_24387/g.48814 Transcript_24387/m.48814 type:complete len:208 (-) Transcript_24387:197-820(-)